MKPLSPETRAAIAADPDPIATVAARYGVSAATVDRARRAARPSKAARLEAIAADLRAGRTWDQVQTAHHVGRSTISRVAREIGLAPMNKPGRKKP
jgi:transposase-like protein